jgi:hypothetical protein
MPTTEQIEAGAKALFECSLAFKTGCFHWPGDKPRDITDWEMRADGLLKTVPADDPSAPQQGGLPDLFRAQARLVLEAAEKAT